MKNIIRSRSLLFVIALCVLANIAACSQTNSQFEDGNPSTSDKWIESPEANGYSVPPKKSMSSGDTNIGWSIQKALLLEKASPISPKRTYLILAADKFKTGVERLKDLRADDFDVVLKTTERGSNENDVKAIIKENLANDSLIVLLIGRCEDMPCWHKKEHHTYVSKDKKWETDISFYTDIFYSDNNDDGYPDISVGRIPASDDQELNTVIDKIVSYEKGLDSGEKRYVFAAGSELDPEERKSSPYNIWKTGSYFDETIIPLIDTDAEIEKIYCYCHNEGKECSTNTEKLVNAINAGADIVTFAGHGSEEGIMNQCCKGEFTTKTIHDDLHNKDNYPIFISLSCSGANILFDDSPYQSFGEEFLTTKDAGAVAFIGSSGTGSGGDNMNEDLFSKMRSQDYKYLGDVFRDSKKPYLYKEKIFDNMYQLLGDPALKLR